MDEAVEVFFAVAVARSTTAVAAKNIGVATPVIGAAYRLTGTRGGARLHESVRSASVPLYRAGYAVAAIVAVHPHHIPGLGCGAVLCLKAIRAKGNRSRQVENGTVERMQFVVGYRLECAGFVQIA